MANHDAFYIGGRWTNPASTATIEIISPHSEEVIATVPDGQPADMDAAVTAAQKAFQDWGMTPFEERLAIVERFAGAYAAHMVEMADLIDDFAGHHFRSAGDIAGSKWFGHVPIKVQDAPSGKAVVREQPDQDGPAAE